MVTSNLGYNLLLFFNINRILF